MTKQKQLSVVPMRRGYAIALFALLLIIYVSRCGNGPDPAEKPPQLPPMTKEGFEHTTTVDATKLKVIADLADSSLNLSVDTNLPDATSILVEVSRSYWEKGRPEEYAISYFSESSTVGKWRSSRSIALDNAKWIQLLKAEQERMSRLGSGFEVARVNEKIEASVIAPLLGSDEVEVNYPLDSTPPARHTSFDPFHLDIDGVYIVSRRTPLMPTHAPGRNIHGTTGVVQEIQQIPTGGAFRVLQRIEKTGQNPWYRVSAIDRQAKRIGPGYINSTALLGQKLETYNGEQQ